MIEDGFFWLKPVGGDMESTCCGCGEPLLISPSDVVNFRMGGETEVMGVMVPTPAGLLCSICNRKENGKSELSVIFLKMVCSHCGNDIEGSDFTPNFDSDGNMDGMICDQCSWSN